MSTKPSSPSHFSTTLDLKLADKLLADLKNQGFVISQPAYTLFSAKGKGVSCTLYKSGKLLVQGKELAQFMEFYLEPEILQAFSYTYSDLDLDLSGRIGVDEAGKGDFFGPLCVAGVFAEGDTIKELHAMGIKDSKTVSDKKTLHFAGKIQSLCPHHVLKLYPAKYNELYQSFHNLNRLLAWGHATILENLVQQTQCHKAIIDKFASSDQVVLSALEKKHLKLQLTQKHRAEADLVVAAASILARAAFLQGLERLSRECGTPLPKGASSLTVQTGKRLLREQGAAALGKLGKLHFKTYTDITQGL